MQFIRREIERELLSMARAYPTVTVLGPRQSGKTTLVRALFADKPYVSLENPDEREFASQDPRSFFATYPQGAILDEIQRLPQLLSYIQGIVDARQDKGLFILTGSHQHELHQSISQSLAGRTSILKLYPFCLTELPQAFQKKELDYYIHQGMYPRVYDDQLDPTKFYRNYLQTYIERDVRQMVNIKDLNMFHRFVKLCAARVGQVFNANSLSNEVGVSSNTIQQWLSILEASFIVFRLQPYFENFGKRMIKSPKLYFVDVGLAVYLLDIHREAQLARDPLRGNLVENFVVSEFIKYAANEGMEPNAYYYRDSNQHEVDLVFKRGHRLVPVEIKASKTFHATFLNGLNYFKQLVPERVLQSFLIYTGERIQSIGSTHITNYTQIKKIYDTINQSV